MGINKSNLLKNSVGIVLTIILLGCFESTAQVIEGHYVTIDGAHSQSIQYDQSKGLYSAVSYDVIESLKDCMSDKLRICLPFSSVQILVPKELVVGEKLFNGSNWVLVDSFVTKWETPYGTCKNVYRLITARKLVQTIQTRTENRYHLLWSEKSGLIGFTDWTAPEDYAFREGACSDSDRFLREK